MTRLFSNINRINSEDPERIAALRTLVIFLNKYLATNWEIYVCPVLNGDYPDLVLLNSYVGVQFIELVMGSRSEYEVEVQEQYNEVERRIIRHTYYSFRGLPANPPFALVDHYREKLISEYLPHLGAAIAQNPKRLSAFRVGLFFPDMTREEAVTLVNNDHCSVGGSDSLSKRYLQVVVKDADLPAGLSMEESWAAEIREWLLPGGDGTTPAVYDLDASTLRDQRVHPSWKDIARFRTPLTEGERHLVATLSGELDDDWEIYVEPFVNGDRPDVVALHPQRGLWTFEVKDWNSQHYFRQNGKLYVRDSRGTWPLKAEKSPAAQIRRYERTWISLLRSGFVKGVGECFEESIQKWIRCVLYCHNMNGNQAKALFAEPKVVICGHTDLSQFITQMATNEPQSNIPDLHQAFARAWLHPPWHFIDQMQPLALTKEQQRFTEPTPKRRQRLRGVAGSGKSLVLAQRAANLAVLGKRVLVISFNITLWHSLRDLVARSATPLSKSLIEFNHFHGFCGDYLKENGIPWPTDDMDADRLFHEIIPNLVLSAKRFGKNRKRRAYDAVLIDEGQDFTAKWFEVLSEFLTENSEVLLVADSRQNVYRREQRWIDQTMSGFAGRWGELKQSYRLPGRVRQEAERFASAYNLPTDIEFEAIQLGFEDPRLVWRDVESLKEATQFIEDTVRDLVLSERVHPSDIAILVPDHADGRHLVETFSEKGIAVNHIFESPDHQHSHKGTFEMGVGKLKICTIHSFKGWEIANILVLTPESALHTGNAIWTNELFYTAITRAKRNLYVFNRLSSYQDYGAGWVSPA